MVNTEYLKIPKDRVGVTIGKNGKIKHQLEIITKTELKIDSDTGNIAISSTDETDDPLAIWKARYMIKAIGRGFNPDIALTLENDDLILEIINLQDYVGKSKKALVRQKGRIIGKNGRTIAQIEERAGISIEVEELEVKDIDNRSPINVNVSGNYLSLVLIFKKMDSSNRLQFDFKSYVFDLSDGARALSDTEILNLFNIDNNYVEKQIDNARLRNEDLY